ncbi:MAG: hypothetical protein J7619_17965 [Dyadobacter sp.]|uniref:hypothetical protein n=1 Tax=Dyadobacter sp. TaxID=1914288 RepID=UPI001B06A9F0|nr:hypothetical protein [Dyadobacter sp.]MBO9614592.1 hypothetical protein [Dyadobacter sp.]
MSYFVKTTKEFESELKQLSKKYPSLSADCFELIQLLKSDPQQGVPLGMGCYKVRLSIKSKRRGKSGGARVVTYVHITKKSVTLLSIYDKSERESITMGALKQLLSGVDKD